jgi:septal ring factor EnvC (AmiA/AmiB activator)
LDKVLKLRGVTFDWRSNHKPEIGLIAQEVEKVFPDLVVTDPNTGYKAVKYQSLVAPLIESTKDLYGMCKANDERSLANERRLASVEENAQAQQAKIDQLQSTVNQLNSENGTLRSELEKQRAEIKAIKDKLGIP